VVGLGEDRDRGCALARPVSGVTGRGKHPQLRSQAASFLCQFEPAQPAWQYHIREEQLDRGVRLQKVERLLGIGSGDHIVAEFGQDGGGHDANGRIVLHDEDTLAAAHGVGAIVRHDADRLRTVG
jgi:hypothetical protein